MIDCDVAEKKNENKVGMSKHTWSLIIIQCPTQWPHPVTTPTGHTLWSHTLATIFNLTFLLHFIKFGEKKRNVRLKIVASGCDQSVWPVGVVTGCGHWVGHWMMISGHVCLDIPTLFSFFFSYITINHHPYIALIMFLFVISVLFCQWKYFCIIII